MRHHFMSCLRARVRHFLAVVHADKSAAHAGHCLACIALVEAAMKTRGSAWDFCMRS